jgi:serine/threonine-protein kinase
MGTVWAADNTVTGRAVALKCIPQAGTYATSRSRVLREARAAALLDHPNVVEVLDAFEREGTWIIVMSLLHGKTLAEWLEQSGALSIEPTATLLLPVVSALGTAHERGLIHRDIKPENIFLLGDGTGVVKVLDFGIAKFDTPGLATHSSLSVGTPAYMSPEQSLRDCEVDCRSDVWALGLVLYQCLLGRRPLIGESIGQVQEILRAQGLPPIESKVPTVPRDIALLLGKMLARRRDERLIRLEEAYETLARYTEVRPPRFGLPHTSVIASDFQRTGPTPTLVSNPSAETQRMGVASRRASQDALEDEKVTSVMPQVVPLAARSRFPFRRAGIAAGLLLLAVATLVLAWPAPPPASVVVPQETHAAAARDLAHDTPRETSGPEQSAGDKASVAPDRSTTHGRVHRRPRRLPIEENPYRFK